MPALASRDFCNKFADLKTAEMYSLPALEAGSLESVSLANSRWTPLGGLRERTRICLFQFWWLLTSLVCGNITLSLPLWSHCFLFLFCVKSPSVSVLYRNFWLHLRPSRQSRIISPTQEPIPSNYFSPALIWGIFCRTLAQKSCASKGGDCWSH